LQKMEEHKGVVVLASNFCQNIDDAFFRRFSAVVEFNAPRVEDRLRLWEKLQQTRTPLAPNVDLAFLAERFELAGGHIRNCIMSAAFQAAAQGEALNMQMLIRAGSREYAKLGKPISKNNFGDYYAAVRREAAGGRGMIVHWHLLAAQQQQHPAQREEELRDDVAALAGQAEAVSGRTLQPEPMQERDVLRRLQSRLGNFALQQLLSGQSVEQQLDEREEERVEVPMVDTAEPEAVAPATEAEVAEAKAVS